MFQHEPNLCISQQVCQACITNDNQGEICNRWGVRENIFYGTDSVERFLNHLAKLSINFNVTVIAHKLTIRGGLMVVLSSAKCIKILVGGHRRL
jgi:hypothetical protein